LEYTTDNSQFTKIKNIQIDQSRSLTNRSSTLKQSAKAQYKTCQLDINCTRKANKSMGNRRMVQEAHFPGDVADENPVAILALNVRTYFVHFTMSTSFILLFVNFPVRTDPRSQLRPSGHQASNTKQEEGVHIPTDGKEGAALVLERVEELACGGAGRRRRSPAG
jgi:hypothetical protein